MAVSYAPLAEPLSQEPSPRRAGCSGRGLALASSLLFAASLLLLGQEYAVREPAINMAALGTQLRHAQATTAAAAASALRSQPLARRSAKLAQIYSSAARFAAVDGARAGCRGDLACTRAVGLFFGTQTGKTEEAAGLIASETGLEAQDIGDASADDLAGFDGLIVGAPTWNTGADDQRSGTAWDDLLEEIRELDLCGKPVAVFGSGDSIGYGDNFCDAIEELHNTFEAAGAKLVGYFPAKEFDHSASKSQKGDKFLGLALDQDNFDDQTEERVKSWVNQIKGEGMPVL